MSKRSQRKNSLRNIIRSGKRILQIILVRYPWLTLALSLTLLLISVLPITESWLYGRLFDSLIETATGGTSNNSALYINLGLVLLIMVVTDVLANADQNVQFSLRQRFLLKVKEMLATKIAYLDQEHFDDPKINNLRNKVQQHYRQSLYMFFSSSLGVIRDLLTILLSITVLFTISPLIILISLAISLPNAFVNYRQGKATYDIVEKYSEKSRDSSSTSSYLSGEDFIREVRSFNIIEYLKNRFLKIDKSHIEDWISLQNKYSYLKIVTGIVSALGFGTIILILTGYVSSGIITVGSLTFYISTSNRFRSSVSAIFIKITRLYERGIYVNDFFDLLDIKNKIKDGEKVMGVLKEPPTIEFKKIWFKYPGTEEYIIKDFDLKLLPGEHLAIVGENGAGKTTLIKLLMRMYDVNKGQILINGTDIKDITLDSWYKHVGTLFQEYNFYHFKVKTNIGVGNVDNMDDTNSIKESAKKSGAHSFIQKYDDNYDQIMSKSFTGGINPSTGQKQRIALARAFFRDSKLLILDEPTSSIDAKGEYEIFERLFEFAQEKSVIIISHRFSTVRNADRIIVLEDGKISEEGTHEELIKIKSGKYKEAFDLQKKGYE
jgi:ATP-binding cassette subfamily B protein